jgi:copper chaperone CopZ
MKSILMTIMLLFAGVSYGQSEVVKIKTSSECGSCKKRIEGKLNYTPGVKYAELDVESKIVEVKFNTKKISADDIRKIISETGYDADDVKAIPSAVEKLPACCKPGGMAKQRK